MIENFHGPSFTLGAICAAIAGFALVIMAMCAAAGEADERMERMMERERQKKRGNGNGGPPLDMVDLSEAPGGWTGGLKRW